MLFRSRLLPALWPAIGVAGLFLAFALFDVSRLVPLWAHVFALLGSAAAFAYALWRGLRSFRSPTPDDARRRLEVKSGFSHRPLEALSDEVTNQRDPATVALWSAHQARALAMVKRIRVGFPDPTLTRHDQLGLRAALGVALVLGFAYAGSTWQDRVWDALGPRAAAHAVDESARDTAMGDSMACMASSSVLPCPLRRSSGVSAGRCASGSGMLRNRQAATPQASCSGQFRTTP